MNRLNKGHYLLENSLAYNQQYAYEIERAGY